MNKKEKVIIEKIQDLLSQLHETPDEEQSTISSAPFMTEKLLQLSKVICWEYDPSCNMVFYHSGKAKQSYPQGRSFTQIISELNGKDRKNTVDTFQQLLLGNIQEASFTYTLVQKDGCFWYEVNACMQQGHIIGTTLFLRHEDDQEQKALQAKLKFELLMSIANVFVWEYDVEKATFTANESLCQKLGLQHIPYTVDTLTHILKIEHLEDFLANMMKQQYKNKQVIKITNRREDMHFIFESSFNSVVDKEGNCMLVLGTLNDITEQELLKNKASRDDLTGCFNRGSADVTLSNTFKRFCEDKEQYTIIFFDIDKFKEYNDNLGHDAGDYVLKRFSAIIMQEIRSSDKLFRWGGDEFLLICNGIAKENMYTYVDRLRRVIECAEFSYGGKKLKVTTSIGAAYYYSSDTSFQDAMKRADRSVYKSKLAGRNNACMLLK